MPSPAAFTGAVRFNPSLPSGKCGGAAQDGWRLLNNGSMVAAPGGGCLAIAASGRRTLRILPCDGSDLGQQFQYTPPKPAQAGRLLSLFNRECVDIDSHTRRVVQTYACNDGPSQNVTLGEASYDILYVANLYKGTGYCVQRESIDPDPEAHREVPGWAFQKHGGRPPLPFSPSGAIRDVSVAYFLGNASGFDSAAEALAESRLGLVGIGWQINNVPSHDMHLEAAELATAKQIKALRPQKKGGGVRVLVSRNTEVVSTFWDSVRAAFDDPSKADYWVKNGHGKVVEAAWVSPAGNTPKRWINFTNDAAAAWWANEYIGAPALSAAPALCVRGAYGG